jgi:hypothetical protein
MVTKSTGIISTVAGDGTSDYVAVGGQAKSAKLSLPSGITFDANENSDIVEVGRIRMVKESTGVISTVTGNGIKGDGGDGGPATSAVSLSMRQGLSTLLIHLIIAFVW